MRGGASRGAERFSVFSRVSRLSVCLVQSGVWGCDQWAGGRGLRGGVFSPVFSFFYSRAPGVGEEKGWGEGHTQWCFSSPPQRGTDVRDERQRRSPFSLVWCLWSEVGSQDSP